MGKKSSQGAYKVAIYCRISGQEQARSGRSLENQESLLRRVAELKFPACECILFSEVASARRTRRKAYQAMIRAARGGYVSAILATEISRLWRNLADATVEVSRLAEWGCDLLIWGQGIDTATPVGKLQFALFSALAEWESDTVSERTKRAFAETRAKGLKGPGRRPYGWAVDGSGRLCPVEEEQKAAAWAEDQRKLGRSFKSIAESLNGMGLLSAESKPWDPGGLRLVLLSVGRRRRQELEGDLRSVALGRVQRREEMQSV